MKTKAMNNFCTSKTKERWRMLELSRENNTLRVFFKYRKVNKKLSWDHQGMNWPLWWKILSIEAPSNSSRTIKELSMILISLPFSIRELRNPARNLNPSTPWRPFLEHKKNNKIWLKFSIKPSITPITTLRPTSAVSHLSSPATSKTKNNAAK